MSTATLTKPHTHDETDSARRAGGPEDKALYLCPCGTKFTAPVSATVDCPDCGSGQTW